MRYCEAINAALADALETHADLMVLGEDISGDYGGAFKVTKGLSARFPDRVISTPISEAAITGVGIGAALRGNKVVIEIMFGDFVSLAFDQLLNHLSKYRGMFSMDLPVIIRSPMGGRRGYGPTHSQSLEKFLVGIPHLEVLYPSELHDPQETFGASVEAGRPIFFCEGKTLYPLTLCSETRFNGSDWSYQRTPLAEGVGTTVTLSNSVGNAAADVVIISYGSTWKLIEEAADALLIDEEITVCVVLLENLSVVDYDFLEHYVVPSGRVILFEECTASHSVGAEIAFQISKRFFKHLRAPVQRVAAEDGIVPSSKILEAEMLPSSSDLVASIMKLVANDF